MIPAVSDASHKNASSKTAKPRIVTNQQPRQTDSSGTKINFSAVATGKAVKVQEIQQKGFAPAPKVPVQATAAKFDSFAKEVQLPQPKVLKEKPVATLQNTSLNSNSGKAEISALYRGHSQGESFTDNANGQNAQGGDSGQNQSERKDAPVLPELLPQTQAENVQQLNGSSPNAPGFVSNAPAGIYGGVIGQLAEQLFRLQQSGGNATTRVTLDLPDGEKLLVRFHVRGNKGMQIQFSTRSKGLRNALEGSWDQLKIESGQRGITLEDPVFEGVGEATSAPVYFERTTSSLR